MNIHIDKEVFRKFNAKFTIAFIIAQHINSHKYQDAVHLLQETERLVRLEFNKDSIKNHNLIAPWAVAQQEFGAQAIHYQTSLEHLLQKVLQGKSIAGNNVITTLAHYLSLKYLVPIGVDDLHKIRGNITFAIATGKEKVGLLRRIKPGALCYHDEKRVLGTKLDFWKNSKTKVDTKSKSVLIHIEALPPVSKKKLQEITREAASLLRTFCGAEVKVVVLDKKKDKATIITK